MHKYTKRFTLYQNQRVQLSDLDSYVRRSWKKMWLALYEDLMKFNISESDFNSFDDLKGKLKLSTLMKSQPKRLKHMNMNFLNVLFFIVFKSKGNLWYIDDMSKFIFSVLWWWCDVSFISEEKFVVDEIHEAFEWWSQFIKTWILKTIMPYINYAFDTKQPLQIKSETTWKRHEIFIECEAIESDNFERLLFLSLCTNNKIDVYFDWYNIQLTDQHSLIKWLRSYSGIKIPITDTIKYTLHTELNVDEFKVYRVLEKLVFNESIQMYEDVRKDVIYSLEKLHWLSPSRIDITIEWKWSNLNDKNIEYKIKEAFQNWYITHVRNRWKTDAVKFSLKRKIKQLNSGIKWT